MKEPDSAVEIEIVEVVQLSAAEQAVAARLAARKSSELAAEVAETPVETKPAPKKAEAKKPATKKGKKAKAVKKAKKEPLPPGKPRRWLVSMTDDSEREVVAENGMVAIRIASDDWDRENPLVEGEKRRYVRGYAAQLNEPHETVDSWRAANSSSAAPPAGK